MNPEAASSGGFKLGESWPHLVTNESSSEFSKQSFEDILFANSPEPQVRQSVLLNFDTAVPILLPDPASLQRAAYLSIAFFCYVLSCISSQAAEQVVDRADSSGLAIAVRHHPLT